MLENISFTDDNGEEVLLYVWEETKVNGYNYLLVSEEPDEDAEVYIFKEVQDDGDSVSYEPVEDDRELQYIGGIFEELLGADEEEEQ